MHFIDDVIFKFNIANTVEVNSIEGDTKSMFGYAKGAFLAPNNSSQNVISIFDLFHQNDVDIRDKISKCLTTHNVPQSTKLNQPELFSFNVRIRQANNNIRCLRGACEKKCLTGGQNSAIVVLTFQDAKTLFLKNYPKFNHQSSFLLNDLNFSALMENTDDYIYFKDCNHVFTGASQTLVQLTEPSDHWTDLLGLTDYDVFEESYADSYYELEKRVFSGEQVAKEIQKTIDNHGNEGWVDNRKYPIHHPSGEIAGLFGIARDITENYQYQHKIQHLLQQQGTVLDNDLVGIIVLRNRRVVWANQAMERLLGYQEDELNGMPTHLVYQNPKDYIEVGEAYSSLTEKGFVKKGLALKNKLGQPKWFDVWGAKLENNSSEAFWFLVDVTERVLSEQAKHESEYRFKLLFEHSYDATLVIENEIIIDANRAAASLFGCEIEQLKGLKLNELTPKYQQDQQLSTLVVKHLINQTLQKGNVKVELNLQCFQSPQTFEAQMTLNAIEYQKEAQIQAIIRDISEQKLYQEKIKQLAFHDSLTNLPNRRLLMERMEQVHANISRTKSYAALCFIDIDEFKKLNDTYGHDIGDLLLIQLAERLTQCVREGDTVARLAGDEFVVLLNNLPNSKHKAEQEAAKILIKLMEQTEQRFQFDSVDYFCSVSIGATVFCDKKRDVDQLIKDADSAMYIVKREGKNGVKFIH